MILGKSVQFRTVYDALLFIRQLMTHLVYDALPISWGFFMTHTIFDASYISRILDFLCNMLYMCSVFYMIFVQFLGVIKCLNNPFFTICRIAHTKKPHRAIFKVTDSYLRTWYLSKIYPQERYIQNLTLCKVQSDPTHLMCTLNRCTRFRQQHLRNYFVAPLNIERR